ncbi:uncharacterized protein Z520_11864 [Fonsecaea multimorphosa CBS 102226]|uniref:SnoaL-like domain-containing protein n=1 Tax=Fonsecaea multimorphosa CBS 102226 TaxID=1442371 RepID=A0A0D2GSD7_9EURO|nr:uncharacterized protein Z520_11864 [Fonsecaea multimorphosa CBS 102226]KIX92390.1 hypothetical protein Z520_11864 [Fonsecaea multimorphosa CBS 102226]
MAATETTQAFFTKLFAAISQEGLGPILLNALHENVKWTATGQSPLSGVYEVKNAYQEDCLGKIRGRLEYSPKPQVNNIIADREWTAVYFHSHGARSAKGVDFGMEYCWWLKVQDDKIVEVIGFFDQKQVYDLFHE